MISNVFGGSVDMRAEMRYARPLGISDVAWAAAAPRPSAHAGWAVAAFAPRKRAAAATLASVNRGFI